MGSDASIEGWGLGRREGWDLIEGDGYVVEGYGNFVDLNPIRLRDLNPVSI